MITDRRIDRFRARFKTIRRRWRKELGQDAFGFAEVARALRECFGPEPEKRRKLPNATSSTAGPEHHNL